jgi:hypothetical protein
LKWTPLWTEVGQLHNPLGNARTAEEHRRLTKGPAIFTRDAPWAAILGLNSDEVVYDLWLKRTGGAPWVIARYVPEKAQLRVSLIKVIRTTEGTQRVLISDWTPEMGKWDIPRRSFLSDNEAYFLGNKGYDPFLPFKASETTPMYGVPPDGFMAKKVMYPVDSYPHAGSEQDRNFGAHIPTLIELIESGRI